MTLQNLHIVSFNVPYPADYGGVIDVFYRLKALSELRVNITLHCFDYGRGNQEELEKYCSKVYYYPRSLSLIKQFSLEPFIVNTRKSKDLLNNLLKDDYPIWYEGIHTTAFLNHPALQGRKTFVRCHNIEHQYYGGLAAAEQSIFTRAYYLLESFRLERFEKKLQNADALFCISEADQNYFKKYGEKVYLLPAFIQDFFGSENKKSIGDYALYHGNLEVPENEEAVLFLAKTFQTLSIPLCLAGKSPSKKLKREVEKLADVRWVENPDRETLNNLIQEARLNCLPAFQSSGIKLKLIHALALGNLVLVNPTMIEGNDLKSYCRVADTIEEWRHEIKEVFRQNLSLQEIAKRQEVICERFNSKTNSLRLLEWLGEVL